MSNLFGTLAKNNVPARYLQLDPYWYSKQHVWEPDPSLYEKGLSGLVEAINGTKLLLYHNFWYSDTQQLYAARGFNWTFVAGYRFMNWGRPRNIFQILPSQAFDFFDSLFEEYRKEGVMMGVEVDFLDWMQLTIPSLFSTLDGGHYYLKGLADAALKHGISHQLCMSMPSQIMDSLLLPAVTNARASPDNTPTNENRWLIAYTSLMMWPLEVQPFADNIWTMAHQPAEPYGHGVFRHNIVLQVLITTLTAGPIGIADQIGYTNSSLILQTCTTNGTLLQPDKPATPIDAMFSQSALVRPPGEVWQAHTKLDAVTVGTSNAQVEQAVLWRYVLGVDTVYSLHQEQLWPPNPNRDTVVVSWHSRHACVTTTTSSTTCVQRRNATQSYELATAPMVDLEHGFDLLVFAPIIWTSSGRGIALLGELSKIVTVSEARFGQSVAIYPNGSMGVLLRGAPREELRLNYLLYTNANDLDGKLHQETFTLNGEGFLAVNVGPGGS